MFGVPLQGPQAHYTGQERPIRRVAGDLVATSAFPIPRRRDQVTTGGRANHRPVVMCAAYGLKMSAATSTAGVFPLFSSQCVTSFPADNVSPLE